MNFSKSSGSISAEHDSWIVENLVFASNDIDQDVDNPLSHLWRITDIPIDDDSEPPTLAILFA